MTGSRFTRMLLAIIASSLLFGLSPAFGAGLSAGGGITRTEDYIVGRINAIRSQHGLTPLTVHKVLRLAARGQSADMAQNDYLGHVDSRGRDLKERLARAGETDWRAIGENVGMSMGYDNNSDVVIEGWLNSPHHRDNILNGNYDTTGIGAAVAQDGTLYVTQVFMRRAERAGKASVRRNALPLERE